MNNKRTVFPGGHSKCEPPETIPNSVVKPLSADDSVGSPHVKVGHCQGFDLLQPSTVLLLGVFYLVEFFIWFSSDWFWMRLVPIINPHETDVK